jgi:hypothetical protein
MRYPWDRRMQEQITGTLRWSALPSTFVRTSTTISSLQTATSLLAMPLTRWAMVDRFHVGEDHVFAEKTAGLCAGFGDTMEA